MNGHTRAGAWATVALSFLIGCNTAPAPGAATPVIGAVSAATDRSAEQRVVVTLPSGERMRRLSNPNGYNHVLIGRVDSDGKRSIACVDSAPAAESFLAPTSRGDVQ